MVRATLFTLLASGAAAFPWVSNVEGVDSSLFTRDSPKGALPGSAATCPYNKKHDGAAPYTADYPYCGAKNGAPGTQTCPNNLVPADGDTAHYYVKPSNKDIRGPCPGLNTAANHNFLSHDGITTFTELIDMQQNVYGVGYDLSVLLAVLGVGLDGDPVTEKLSIGCDASDRTSFSDGSTGNELGLDGHNKFEGDTSLTRNDYFLGGGDNFSFNKTLYKEMSAVANGNFSRDQLALYRKMRWTESLNTNGNFYFGPKALLLFGASSFVYELFPSLGPAGPASQANTDSFFIDEKIPAAWFSRVSPYTIPDVAGEIYAQYQEYPVPFGGNQGKPNTYVGLGEEGPYISSSILSATPAGIVCFLYQFATGNQPSSIQGPSDVPDSNFQWAAGKLNPLSVFGTFGCPLAFNDA